MRSYIACLTCCLFLVGCELSTFTSGISIAWDIPTERENGERLFLYEVGGYELAYKRENETLFRTLIVESGDVTDITIPNLTPGIYEVKIAAFDSNGLYSRFSESVFISTTNM